MEKSIFIQEVGAYSERQYQRQDGTQEYFKSRGMVEMTGELASKNRETQYDPNRLYVVKGFWKHRTWQDQQGQMRHENMFYITDIQAL